MARTEPTHHILFSYAPYAVALPNLATKGTRKNLEKIFNNYDPDDHAHAECLVWVNLADQSICPVFAVHNAKALAEHLLAWAEQDRTWFTLHGKNSDKAYCFALMPDLTRSIARWKINYNIITGKAVPDESTFTILCKPIRFGADLTKNFHDLKERLQQQTKVTIGLVDITKIDRTNPKSTNPEDIIDLGEFAFKWGDSAMAGYLDEYLKEADKH